MIFQLLFLYKAVLSEYFVSTNYRSSEFCEGVPATIIGFNVSDPNLGTQPDNEYWAPYYRGMSPIYPYIPVCGSAQVQYMEGDCCYSIIRESIYFSAMQNLESSVNVKVDNFDNIKAAIPYIPTLSKYCKIENILGPLFLSYNFLYILNDNECTEMFLKCSSEGVLSSFPEPNCDGEPIKYTLGTKSILIEDSNQLGIVYASTVDLNGGSAKIGWINFQPQYELVPNHKSFLEILATILFTLSLIICTTGVAYWGYKYRNRTLLGFIMFVASPITILFYLIARVIYAYLIFELTSLYTFKIFLSLSFALSTLISSISTTLFLVSVIRFKKFQTVSVYVTLGCIHILFCGANYFTYFELLQILGFEKTQVLIFSEFVTFVGNWHSLDVYWILFLFLWNILPMLATVSKFTKFNGESLKGRIKASAELDKQFLPLVVIQSVFFAIYLTCGYLQKYSSILGNDRSYVAVDSIKAFCIVMNVINNCVLIERAKIMFVRSKEPMKKYLKAKASEKHSTSKENKPSSFLKIVASNRVMTGKMNQSTTANGEYVGKGKMKMESR